MTAPFLIGQARALVGGQVLGRALGDAALDLAGVDGPGVQRGPKAARWLLMSDEIGVSIQAPHEVRQVQEVYSLQTSTFGSLTDGEWASMPMGSQPRTIAVTAEWRARDYTDDLRDAHWYLTALGKHHAKIGRRPIVNFAWGPLRLEGYIRDLSFTWIDGTFDEPPYLPQAFVVSITVVATHPRILETTSLLERSTKQRRIGSGETFESVAWDEYGDPDLGNVLRRHNPGVSLAGEVPGDVVRYYAADHSIIRNADPLPQSPALGGDVADVLQPMAVERIGERGPGLLALEEALGL